MIKVVPICVIKNNNMLFPIAKDLQLGNLDGMILRVTRFNLYHLKLRHNVPEGGLMIAERTGFFSSLPRVFNDSSSNVKGKVIGIYTFLISLNVLVWVVSLIAFARFPALIGTALLAYSFGLRHAVDADHISAIDNVTRKLMQEKKQPVAVGFFFGLGHSTIVLTLGVVIAFVASFMKANLTLQSIGGVIGTGTSAFFLYVIALINGLMLWDIFRAFRKVKRGEEYNEATLEEFLNKRGLLARFFRPLFKITTRSWHMYPIGILFGLGFETATEVAILAIEVRQVIWRTGDAELLKERREIICGKALCDA